MPSPGKFAPRGWTCFVMLGSRLVPWLAWPVSQMWWRWWPESSKLVSQRSFVCFHLSSWNPSTLPENKPGWWQTRDPGTSQPTTWQVSRSVFDQKPWVELSADCTHGRESSRTVQLTCTHLRRNKWLLFSDTRLGRGHYYPAINPSCHRGSRWTVFW